MEKTLQPGQNTGVVLIQPDLAKVWVAGAETGIAKVVLEPSAGYDFYLPDEETQNRLSKYGVINFDALACVTFSATNSLETLINRLRAKGQLSTSAEKFLKDNGYVNPTTNKVNFSDRFSAKMSGTTHDGNNLQAVADSIRNDGMVPENMWPFPEGIADIADINDRWNTYYAPITQNVVDLGKEFTKHFQTNTQWVALGTSTPSLLKDWLKYGPLQVATLVCSPWSSTEGMPPIPACGCGAGHAHTVYGYTETGWKDFDSYKSFKKILALDYCIPWAVQYYISEVTEVKEPTLDGYVFKTQLKYGAPASTEVKMLQTALQILTSKKTGKPYMTKGSFGPFGPQTKAALGLFQTEHAITDPDGQGTNFGPKTQNAVNVALAK